MGPVVEQPQLETDLEYIGVGQREGARLAYGGERLKRDTDGYYLAPTLFTEATNAMRISREEIFGPVACVIRAKNYDEALAIANDTETGLSSGIVTTSLKHATHFKRHAQAGMVMVNLPTAGVDYHVPFGGRKASSYGPRERGGGGGGGGEGKGGATGPGTPGGKGAGATLRTDSGTLAGRGPSKNGRAHSSGHRPRAPPSCAKNQPRPPLAVQVAEEALARAAEREVGHRRGDADVDPDVAHLRLVAELAGVRAARGEQAGLVAVGAGVHQRDRRVDVVHVMDRQHRARRSRCAPRRSRSAGPRAPSAARSARPDTSGCRDAGRRRPAARRRESPCRSGCSIAGAALRRDDRPHLHALVEAVSGDARLAARSPIASVNGASASPTATANDDARQRWPAQPNALSAMISDADAMSASGITITGFLAPPWHCTRLPAAPARVDVPRDRARSDEAHRSDDRVIEDRVHRLTAAVHQVHDARRAGAGCRAARTPSASSAAPAPRA